MAVPAHALPAVQVRLKSVRNEGPFTLEAETVFRPYLPSYCSGVTQVYNMELPTHALLALQVRLITESNKGHFILEAQTVFHPYIPSHCSAVTETCHMAPLRMRYVQCQLG
jgi:hypothetical protein